MWEGTLGPDPGAATADDAENEITITFNVLLDDGVTSAENLATLDADLNGDEDFDDPGESVAATADAASSGREVPIATIVRPIIASDRPAILAMLTAESTANLPPKARPIMPAPIITKAIHVL